MSLDRVTEFRAAGLPLGAGVMLDVGQVIGEVAGGLSAKFLGSFLGSMSAAVGQAGAAYALMNVPAVQRLTGPQTAELLAAQFIGNALDQLLQIKSTVRSVVASTGLVSLGRGIGRGVGRPLAAAPAAAAAVYRSDVERKAASVRL